MTNTDASIAGQRADERDSRTRAAMAQARGVLTASLERHGQRCTAELGGRRCMRPTGHDRLHETTGPDHRTISWDDKVEPQ